MRRTLGIFAVIAATVLPSSWEALALRPDDPDPP
jgi:hypothetical protein